ncbi:hypothetical protein ACU8KH_05472 [Lachancea thermotolerans]
MTRSGSLTGKIPPKDDLDTKLSLSIRDLVGLRLRFYVSVTSTWA